MSLRTRNRVDYCRTARAAEKKGGIFVKITNYISFSRYYGIRTGAQSSGSRRRILYFKKGMVTKHESIRNW